MNTKKYHKDTGIPPQISNLPQMSLKLDSVSTHALNEMESDKFGIIQFRESIEFSGDSIFEFETNKQFNKFGIRLHEDSDFDSCWIVQIDRQTGKTTLRTVWLNHKSDTHKTLDKSKYIS